MGWGMARQRAYNVLLRLTCQTLNREGSSDEKSVSGSSSLEGAIDLTITSASARPCRSMGGRNDQSSRRRCNCQDHAWPSVRKCVPSSHGKTDIDDPSLETDLSTQIAQFCVYRFCQHPKYHERLRAEALECKDISFSSLNQEMPYLDSFVKETARLSPGPIRKSAALLYRGSEVWL